MVELAYQLKDTGARLLLAHPTLLETAIAAAEDAGLGKNQGLQFSDEPCKIAKDVTDWRTILGRAEEAETYRWKSMSEEESASTVATLNYSSGTTGLPKGVCCSHHNWIANVEQTISVRRLGVSEAAAQSERWLCKIKRFCPKSRSPY